MSDTYYNSTLASIHDLYYGDLARQAAAELVDRFTVHGLEALTVVDLGCGSGTLAACLSEYGARVVGIDSSASMIALAQRNAPHATFVQCSLYDYHLPEADIVTAIGEPFNYLFDERCSLKMVSEVFRRVANSLKPNGLFLFDVLTPELGDLPHKRVLRHDATEMHIEYALDAHTRILTRIISMFEGSDENASTDVEIHRQLLFPTSEIRSELEALRFKVTECDSYHDMRLRRGHVAFACVKC